MTREALEEFTVTFEHRNKDKLPHEHLFINITSCRSHCVPFNSEFSWNRPTLGVETGNCTSMCIVIVST